jgi:hypothetical protein
VHDAGDDALLLVFFRRCEARVLELDLAQPRRIGGSDDAENLRVRCRGHNQLCAEQIHGREHIARRQSFRRESRCPTWPNQSAQPTFADDLSIAGPSDLLEHRCVRH